MNNPADKKKRFLTMFWYDDAGPVHLYKDVGGIPYALAKYCGWETTFAYNDINGIIEDEEYEKYVNMRTIHYNHICRKLKFRFVKYWRVAKFVWENARDYDVINFYHTHKFIMFLCWLAKKRNPDIITYVKMDMGEAGFNRVMEEKQRNKRRLADRLAGYVDLFTVEAQKYAKVLRTEVPKYKRIQYLPNGFFSDFLPPTDEQEKENIILTVGRIGTRQKNSELLINALAKIPEKKLAGWKIYIVGPVEPLFQQWLEEKYKQQEFLKKYIVVTGEIYDKGKLAQIYQRAKVFVLSSRFESWGLVVPEAMSFREYIIATDCCEPFREYIDTTEQGFGRLIENENLDMLRVALEEVLDEKIDVLRKGRLAGKFAAENLDWQVVIKRLESYFTAEKSKHVHV